MSNPLPKMLKGSVHAQWVRCGKPNCRCRDGELHGPYYYHFYRVDGRLHKRYVAHDRVETIRDACAARRHHRDLLCDSLRAARETNKKLKELIP